MEALLVGGQGPEGAVAPHTDGWIIGNIKHVCYILKWNKSERKRCVTFENLVLNERRYTTKNNPRRVEVNTSCPPHLPVHGRQSAGSQQWRSQNIGTDSIVSRFSSASCKGSVQYIYRIGARHCHILSY